MKTIARRSVLGPPVFEDKEETRRAHLLFVILWVSFAISLLISLSLPLINPDQVERLVILGPLPVVNLVLLGLLRTGRVRLVSSLLTGTVWLAIAASSITGGGLRSAAFAVVILGVIITSFLLGNRAGLLMAILSGIFGLGLLVAEFIGGLLPPVVAHNSSTLWLIYTSVALLGAVVIHLANRSVAESLALARQSERVLSAQNLQLEQQAQAARQANRAFRVLSGSNQAQIRAADEAGLLQEVCRIVVEEGGYRLVWIGYAESDTQKTVRPAAQAGFEAGYLESANITWADTGHGRGPTGTAIRTGRPCVVRDVMSDPVFAPWRYAAVQRGFTSVLALPLLAEGQTFGVLVVYAAETNAFDDLETELLVELADDLAFGITALRARAERAAQAAALRQSENRYRTMVEKSPFGTYVFRPDGSLRDFNEAAVRLWNASPQDIAHYRRHYNVREDEQLEAAGLLPFIERSFEGEATVSGAANYTFVSRSLGQSVGRWVMNHSYPILDDGGRVTEVVLIQVDVTDYRQAISQLESTQKRMEHLLATSPAVIYSAESEAPYAATFVSEKIKNQLGYEPQECLDDVDWWASRIHPEDQSRIFSELPRLFETGHHVQEYRFRHKDGSYRWIHDELSLARDNRGVHHELIGSLIDITERRMAEEEREQLLREARKRAAELNTLLKTATVIASTHDLDELARLIAHQVAILLDVDGCTLSRWDRATDSLYTWIEFRRAGANGNDRPGTAYGLGDYPATRAVLESGQPYGMIVHDTDGDPAEAAMMRTKGETSLLMLPIRAGSETLGLMELDEETRERRFTVEEISLCQALANQAAVAIQNASLLENSRTQAQQMEQILRSVPEGIVLVDAAGRVLMANPVGRHHVKTLAGAEVGDTVSHLAGQPLLPLLESIADGRSWYEVVVAGQDRFFELAASTLRPATPSSQPAGRQGSWVLILRDVSEEHQQQKYRQAQERLATVGQLAAGVAHDFNNIMAVITLYSDLILRSGNPDRRSRERLAIVRQQATRAADLTSQILDFSRRSVMERVSFEIVPFIKEFVKLAERTLPENILINFSYDDGDAYLINADPGRLQQVLVNLSLNARDAMPAGGRLTLKLTGLRLDASQHPPVIDMRPGQWLALTVSDTGAGIDEAHLPHIFEPFFSTKAPGHGTGLGLAQAYGIIRSHDGHIAVSSRSGEGTSFEIYLPLLAPSEDPAVGPAVEEGTGIASDGETILLVEDNADARAAVRAVLEMENYQVIEAINGQDGLAIYEQENEQIDLILSDLVMPVMGGEALIKALWEKGLPAKTVLMTGYPLEDAGRELLELGLVAWVAKPFSADKIATVVKKALAPDSDRVARQPLATGT